MIYQGIKKEKHVLAYASRCLVQDEGVYTMMEIEALAVIWAIKFCHYLFVREFVLVRIIMHCSLQTMKDPKGKLGRWLLELSEHHFTVFHKSCLLKYPDGEDERICVTVQRGEVDCFDLCILC